MFYDLLIHPSRIEFFHRVFSPDRNEFVEKKLGSSELGFKFDPSMIGNGENYELLKKTVHELIDPYRKDFNSINIVVGPAFFQMKTIICDKFKADYQEYINWEATFMANGHPEQFRYGYVFMEHDNRLLIGVVRKQVYDYFSRMLHEIYSSNIDCKLGCAYPLPNFKEIVVYADKLMAKPFTVNSQANKAGDDLSEPASVAVKALRSPVFLLILLFLFIAASAVSLIYYAPDFTRSKIEQIASLIPSGEDKQTAPVTTVNAQAPSTPTSADTVLSDSVSTVEAAAPSDSSASKTPSQAEVPAPADGKSEQKTAIKSYASGVTEKQTPPSVPVDPSLDPHPEFWNYVISAVEIKTDSIIFVNGAENGVLNFYTNDQTIIKQINQITLKNAYKGSTYQSGYIVSDSTFRFVNSRKRSNYNRFLEVKTRKNLNPPDPDIPYVFSLNSLKQLQDVLSAFNSDNVGFRKFIIIRNGESVSIAVYFG
jgi:hypothetical protein